MPTRLAGNGCSRHLLVVTLSAATGYERRSSGVDFKCQASMSIEEGKLDGTDTGFPP
jgi:hypothetical protein